MIDTNQKQQGKALWGIADQVRRLERKRLLLRGLAETRLIQAPGRSEQRTHSVLSLRREAEFLVSTGRGEVFSSVKDKSPKTSLPRASLG